MIEILLALYLFSGSIKGLFYSVHFKPPVDFTLATGLVFFAAVIYSFIKRKDKISLFTKDRIYPLILFFLFFLWCLFTLTFDSSEYEFFPGEYYGFKKAFLFFTCIISFVSLFLYPQLNLKKFMKYFVGLSLIVGTVYLLFTPAVFYVNYYKTTETIREPLIIVDSFVATYLPGFYKSLNFDLDPILSFGLVSGQFLGASVLMLLFFQNSLKKYLAISFCFILLVVSGARGPLIFVILLLAFYILWINRSGNIIHYFKNVINTIKAHWHIVKSKSGLIAVGISLFFISILIINPVFNLLLKRNLLRYSTLINYAESRAFANEAEFKLMLKGKKGEKVKYLDTSIYARELYYKNAAKLSTANFKRFMTGYGFGNYAKVSNLTFKIDDHPHNIFLEILIETGLIGLLLFSSFLFFVFRSFKENHLVISIVVFFIILNALKSIPLVERNLFAFFSLAIYVHSARIDKFKLWELEYKRS